MEASSKAPLESVYSDGVGPIKSSSFAGAKYFVTLLGEYKKCSVIKIVGFGNFVAGIVIKMIRELETSFNRKLKTIFLL